MRELVLFTLEDTQYGIWRDQFLSVEEVQSLHRLPFARASLTVLSVFGGRTETLADLALCLGHPAIKDAGGASAWLLSDRESIRGFLVSGERESVQAAPEALIPSPDFLRALPLEGFFRRDSFPVPVLNVSALYERVRRAEREKQAPPLVLKAQSNGESRSAARFRIFASSGSLFAAPGTVIAETTMSGRQVARIPLLPPNIAGVALSRDRILPVVDLALRVTGSRSRENSRIIEATLNGTALGFLVDEDEGEWRADEVAVKDLPPVLRAPWMSSAVLRGAQIAPLIQLGALLSGPSRGDGGGPHQRLHSPDSQFHLQFGRQAVEVTEFSALGTIFAVPQSEVVDVLPWQPFQEFALAAGLVAGLVELNGDLVPVLDLARLGEEHPQKTADWRMIALKNGDFQALIMCERAGAARTLDPDVQRDVPVVLPFPVVYGCYTDKEAVRLVLNMEELAVHYHQSGAALLLPALTRAMGGSLAGARAARDVPQPVHAEVTPAEPALPEVTSEAPATENEPLPEPQSPSELPLPAELVLSSLEPSPVEPGPVEAVPMEPRPVAEEQVPAESAPSAEPAPAIGEDILEPVHPAEPSAQAAPGPAIPEPRAAAETPPAEPAKPAPARSKAAAPAHGRTVRRVLSAAAIAVVVGGCVFAGFHFGIFRPRPAATTAPAPAEAQQNAVTSPESPPPGETLYVVKEGDTLWDIAARFTGDAHNYQGLATHNGIPDPDVITPGQVIKVPR